MFVCLQMRVHSMQYEMLCVIVVIHFDPSCTNSRGLLVSLSYACIIVLSTLLNWTSYKYALCLHCRHFRDVSSTADQRCPNWQRCRLRLALHLLAGITTSAQNAANSSKRQVLFSVAHSHLCVLELPSVWHKICIDVHNPFRMSILASDKPGTC